MPAYKRIMLKLSGEALSGEKEFGLDHDSLHRIAEEIMELVKAGVQVAVTIGGGNIWRYRDTTNSGIDRSSSDVMGMLATIMNAVALQAALEAEGASCRVCSAIDVPQVAE